MSMSSELGDIEQLRDLLLGAAREGNAEVLRHKLGLNDDPTPAGHGQSSHVIQLAQVPLSPPARQLHTTVAGPSSVPGQPDITTVADPSSGSSGSQVTETGIQNVVGSALHNQIAKILRQCSEDGGSLLHVVAASGDDDKYRECAGVICKKNRQILSENNKSGETALDCAARAGHRNMVLLLLYLELSDGRSLSDAERAEKAEKIIGKTDGYWETDLHRAVRKRDDRDFGRLKGVDNGGLARVPDIDGMPPLYLAIFLGYNNIVDRLIETFGDTLSYDGPNGQNALHAAALRSEDLTSTILQKRGTLKIKPDCYGSVPLHFAASVGVNGITSCLLQGTAESTNDTWNIKDNKGMFPIHIAASVGAMDAIKPLMENAPHLRDAMGRTLLHIAIENQRSNVVELICREPRPELMDIVNFFLCRRSSNVAFVDILKKMFKSRRSRQEYKDILNMKDNNGNTALHLAVEKRDQTIFSYLLGNMDVDLNHVNIEGYTPLDLASRIKMEHSFASPQNPTEWMIRVLSHSGAHFSPRRRDELIIARSSEKRDKHGETLAKSTESVLVASALIATLTFAAAFTMPGSYNTDSPKKGTPALGIHYGFKVFLVADIFAFYFAVAATFSLAEYGNRANVDPLVRCTYARYAVRLFHVALKSIIIAFAFGVSVEMWDISLSSTIIVGLATFVLVLYGNVALIHDFRLMLVMYQRFGFSSSWFLNPSTSTHLDWTSWRLTSFSATLVWNLVKLFWTYILIFVVAYVAQLKEKS